MIKASELMEKVEKVCAVIVSELDTKELRELTALVEEKASKMRDAADWCKLDEIQRIDEQVRKLNGLIEVLEALRQRQRYVQKYPPPFIKPVKQ